MSLRTTGWAMLLFQVLQAPWGLQNCCSPPSFWFSPLAAPPPPTEVVLLAQLASPFLEVIQKIFAIFLKKISEKDGQYGGFEGFWEGFWCCDYLFFMKTVFGCFPWQP